MKHANKLGLVKPGPVSRYGFELVQRTPCYAQSATRDHWNGNTAAGSQRREKEGIRGESEIVPSESRLQQDAPHDILIVASKMKNYIKARSGMNTSESVLEILSDHVRALCDRAIESAEAHERRTVMDRDYPNPHAGPTAPNERRKL